MPEKNLIPLVNFSNWKLTSSPFCSWGPRTIPDTELIYIHDGHFELALAPLTLRAGTGSLLAIFPGEHHRFQCLEKTGTISCIHCDLPKEISLPQSQPVSDPDIPDAFRRCAEVFLHPSPQREKLLRTILTELILRLQPAGPLVNSPIVSDRVAEMARYIREHIEEPITRSVLAKKFNLSPQHINHLFKTELGTSPTALLHRERAKQAFLLIQNEQLSVKEAAERTGFCDAYHLSKVFKKAYGFPPSRVNRFFKPQ